MGVPVNSVVEFVCDSGPKLKVYYPNVHDNFRADNGEYDKEISIREHEVREGERLVVFIVDDGDKLFWISEPDFEHSRYIFGHGFHGKDLQADWIKPGFILKFSLVEDSSTMDPEKVGYLTNIDVGAETELIINMIDFGFLIEPVMNILCGITMNYNTNMPTRFQRHV